MTTSYVGFLRTRRMVCRTWLSAVIPVVLLTSLPVGAHAQFEVAEAGILELQEAMATGRTSSVAITEGYLERIRAYDRAGPRLNAILRLNPMALAEAEAADLERAAGLVRGPLHGIPVVVKESFDVAGLPTSAGSLALARLLPPDDAAQVAMLRNAGAVILAKTGMDEFGLAFLGRASLSGQTLNPYSLARSPGGSSGGSAVAVASSFAAVGWGTDTCGSLRVPAAHSGLVALRPTVGLSSTDGVFPVSRTLDVAAPLARTAIDLAIALDATIGFGESTVESLLGTTFVAALEGADLHGKRIGLLVPLLTDPPEARTGADLVVGALEEMQDMGAEVILLDVRDLRDLAREAMVVGHEFKWDVANYLAGVPGDHPRSLTEILASGLVDEDLLLMLEPLNLPEDQVTPAYLAALDRRAALQELILQVMEVNRLDAIAYPTVNSLPSFVDEDPVPPNCALSSASGFPAITLPAGYSHDLPVGLELLARPFEDAKLLGMAHAFEQATRHRRPPPSVPPLVQESELRPMAFRIQADIPRIDLGAGDPGELAVELLWNPMTGRLAYALELSGLDPAEVHAVVLRTESAGEGALVVRNLLPPGVLSSAGEFSLGDRNRERLLAERLYVEVFTTDFPEGTARTRVVVP
jgi:amidase